MPFEKALQFDEQVVCAYQARRNVSVRVTGNVKLGRSPGWNLVRAKRSRICIYASVKRQLKDREVADQAEPIARIRNNSTCVPAISSVRIINECTRSAVKMELDFALGESRG